MMNKIISISLLFVYSLLLTIPYLPYIVFLTTNFKSENINVVEINKQRSFVGDACYLKAIIERSAKKSSKKKSVVPPPPPVETLGLVYINSVVLFTDHQLFSKDFNFKRYMISIKESFLEVDIPPPKLLS